MVLSEVRGDVIVGVDLRDVDPCAIARGVIADGRLDVHADLRDGEHVATSDALSADQRETERTDRCEDRVLLRALGEGHDQRAFVVAGFDGELEL
jgi:hypothetical protein